MKTQPTTAAVRRTGNHSFTRTLCGAAAGLLVFFGGPAVGTLQAQVQSTAASDVFISARNYATGVDTSGLAVGDVNGDGWLDVATANWDAVSVLLGNGDGSLQAAASYPAGYRQESLAVGDFNGDLRPDLVTVNIGRDNVSSQSPESINRLGESPVRQAASFAGKSGGR